MRPPTRPPRSTPSLAPLCPAWQVGESVRTYAAMVWSLDHAFGKAVEALRHAHMLPHSLIAFMSDNGGGIPVVSDARTDVLSNYPLAGGKHTNLEGGVRVAALVSGGWLPAVCTAAAIL